MPDYSSLVPGIASSLGIPTPLALAMLSQESGVGQTSQNIGQVLPSTAASPGFGMAPLDPSDINPTTPDGAARNIRFSLQYLKNKAAASGYANLNDPTQAAGALKGYNGGGDPNYVQNVSNRMPGSPLPGSTGYIPPSLPNVNTQASPPPPMPAGFAAAPPPSTASAPAQVNMDGHQGDPSIAMGLAMMGGNGWHDAMAKAGQAYAGAQAQSLQAAELNAGYQNDAQNRDADAPQRAAQTAALRAQAWNSLNAPTTITAEQAAQNALTQRGQNVQLADSIARAQYMSALTKGQPQQFVVPGQAADGSQDTIFEGTKNGAGQFSYTNTATGQQSNTLPQGAVPQQLYNQQQVHANKLQDTSNKTEADVLNQGTQATAKLNDLQRTEDDLNQPGALAGPGLGAKIGRSIDTALGTSMFGDLSNEQTAQLDTKSLNWQNVRQATQGTGRLMANEINILSQNAPTIATDPTARQSFFNVLKNAAQRQKDVADAWTSMDPVTQTAIKRSGTMNQWLYNTNSAIYQKQAQQQADRAAATIQAAPTATTGSSPGANRPPLASFGSTPQAAPTSAPMPDPTNSTAAIPG